MWAAALAPPRRTAAAPLRVTSRADPAGRLGRLHRPGLPRPAGVRWPTTASSPTGARAVRRAATLVADLARELPEPGPDGRTYVFRLRPGVRFSDGAPVRPEDVRASIERSLQVIAREPGFCRDYLPIRGASRCRATHCDLSGGIETDAPAADGHHPSEPAATSSSCTSCVNATGRAGRQPAQVRPDARARRHRSVPVRAVGSEARRVLVRNPHFRVWSPDRPDGFPDRSSCATTRRGRSSRRSTAARRTSPGRSPRARRHAGSRTRVRRHGCTPDPARRDWLRVPERPRSRRSTTWRVRRALNFAVDRGAGVAELLGSPETQQPTCQLLPPGFQGYTPSCPFTLDPNAAGHVDRARPGRRARRLIAASGHARHEGRVLGQPRRSTPLGRLLPHAAAPARLRRPAADVHRSCITIAAARHAPAPAARYLGLGRRLRRAR